MLQDYIISSSEEDEEDEHNLFVRLSKFCPPPEMPSADVLAPVQDIKKTSCVKTGPHAELSRFTKTISINLPLQTPLAVQSVSVTSLAVQSVSSRGTTTFRHITSFTYHYLCF